jgi:hypothetical protein
VNLQRLQIQLSSTKNILTTMAPTKLGAPSQACKRPQSNVRAPSQPQGREQQPTEPPEVVHMDEIPSPDMTPTSPTPVVEETQQTTPLGMDMDRSDGGQGQQAECTGNHSYPKNPEETSRVNGTIPNKAETTTP